MAYEGPVFDGLRAPVVLFDFDGTVADTKPAIYRFVRAAVASYGMPEPREEQLRAMIGPPLVDGFQEAFGVPVERAEELTATYRAIMEREVTPADYPAFPGMPELLADLAAGGRRLAVASSRRETSLAPMVAALGLDGRFAAVVGGVDGVRHTKAESIRAALAALGASADQAVMVGDRRHDVAGAHEVGLPCIGVYTGTAAPGELEAAGADAIAHGVDGLRPPLGVGR